MTRAQPDYRLVLDNPHLGWPAETTAEAQADYDARLRALRPDDPGVDHDSTAFDRTILRAPVRPTSAEHARRWPIIVGGMVGILLAALAAWAWGL